MTVSLLLVLISSSMQYLGRVVQKKALHQFGGLVFFQRSLYQILLNIKKIFNSPFLLLGYFISISSTILWFLLLAVYDLSLIIPLGGLSYILALLFGRYFFKEKITTNKWVGLVLISIGTFFLFQ